MDLKNVDSELLRKELNRRHEEEQRKKKEFNDNRRTLQQSALTSEVIDALLPGHTRTSCSDDNQVNGWGSYSGGGARCTRCAILQGLPDGYHLELTIEAD